jgi:hypothetical protein
MKYTYQDFKTALVALVTAALVCIKDGVIGGLFILAILGFVWLVMHYPIIVLPIVGFLAGIFIFLPEIEKAYDQRKRKEHEMRRGVKTSERKTPK